MALEVTVNDGNFPDGHELEIVGLGAFKNGEATEIPEDAEMRFVAMHQKPVDEVIGTSDVVSVSGSSSIQNMDDVLGKDISDTPAPPDLEAMDAANAEDDTVAEDAGQPTVTLPASVTGNQPDTTDTGGDA